MLFNINGQCIAKGPNFGLKLGSNLKGRRSHFRENFVSGKIGLNFLENHGSFGPNLKYHIIKILLL